eukprot:m.134403 g.134403  ORF g.134403 m.134403 type:complete len:140 (+) comp9594_c0_seq1:109-528(+)
MMNNNNVKAVLLVLLAFSTYYAYASTCSCTVYCWNGYDSYTVDYNAANCSECSYLCSTKYSHIANQYCPSGRYSGSGYSCLSSLAVGIIAAIVVGVLVVVVCFPLIVCFCMGLACFGYRKNNRSYTVVQATTTGYGTSY